MVGLRGGNMTSHQLQHETGWVELPPAAADKWQKRVVILLTLLVALLIVFSAAFLWAETNGLFQSSADQTTPSWPSGLQ